MTSQNTMDDVLFHPSGRYLLTRSGNIAEVWLLRPDDLIAAACTRLTWNLTTQEWTRFIGDEPYRKTCENLPYPEDYEPVSNVSHSD